MWEMRTVVDELGSVIDPRLQSVQFSKYRVKFKGIDASQSALRASSLRNIE
jgi:hypothetical protein